MRTDLARAVTRGARPPSGIYGDPVAVPRPPRPDLTLPEILVALPNGEQGRLSGVYRRSGWRKLRDCKPWAGTGTWSKGSRTNAIADGAKGLWAWFYDDPEATTS